jgi:uncharacterized protein (TIGR03000 family)
VYSRAICFAFAFGLAGFAVGLNATPAAAAGLADGPYGVLHHYGYYNPYAYTSRYLYYPFVGGGAYPWYDYRPYYGWSIVPGSGPEGGAWPERRREARYYTPAAPSGPLPAHITLKVPADAEVWFNGQKTKATGTVRDYDSPPLASGYRYTYQIRVSWQHDGRTIAQHREVSVTSGARMTVAFPQRDASQPAAEPSSPH